MYHVSRGALLHISHRSATAVRPGHVLDKVRRGQDRTRTRATLGITVYQERWSCALGETLTAQYIADAKASVSRRVKGFRGGGVPHAMYEITKSVSTRRLYF